MKKLLLSLLCLCLLTVPVGLHKYSNNSPTPVITVVGKKPAVVIVRKTLTCINKEATDAGVSKQMIDSIKSKCGVK